MKRLIMWCSPGFGMVDVWLPVIRHLKEQDEVTVDFVFPEPSTLRLEDEHTTLFQLAEKFSDRCFDQETQEFNLNCQQPTSLSLLFSGYGTYLLAYYDGSGQIISSEEGEWRWLPNTETPYSIIQVRFENEPWEESDALVIEQVTESSLLIQEMTTNEDGTSSPNDDMVIYNFQLASLPYADSSCGDLTEYSDTDN